MLDTAAFFAIWLLLVDRIQGSELAVGVAVSALAAVGTKRFRDRAKIRVKLPERWGSALYAAARNALVETVQLLIRPRKRGRFLRVSFAAAERGPRGATRRALAIALTSVSANSIVIEVDPHRKMLLLHQALTAPAPDVIRILEGR